MAFLDEEEEIVPAGTGRRRRIPDHRRQILARRVIALALLILIAILLIVGIKGCLNARKERSLENYASDVGSVVAQTKQLSTDFFGRLSAQTGGQNVQAELAADRGTAAGLVDRLEALSVPDEVKSAQSELILAYELRRDGVTGTADSIAGLNSKNQAQTTDDVVGDMKELLASDVIYARARDDINQALVDNGVDKTVPASVFLTDPETWLDNLQVGQALAVVGGAKATKGSHGMALYSVSIGATPLSTDTPVTVSGDEVAVEVQNQGDVAERNVAASVELTGGARAIQNSATIPGVDAQGLQTAKVPLKPAPPKGQELTLEVTVQPVLGEQIIDNNTATYTVTFR